MNFDSQKKIISENNPIDFIEEYVINEDKAIYRDSRDEITIFSNGIWKKYDVSFFGAKIVRENFSILT